MNNLNQEENCQKTINNNLTSTIDKLIKSFQQQQNSSSSSTNLKPCSPSPPLLLLQSGTEETIKMDKIHSDISNSSSIDKPLALIQASDLNEMNKVLKSLKNNFPNVTIHLCLNNINETNLKEERKISPRHSLTPSSYEKNCLTASYLSDKFKHSDRPSSLDNSSLSACMERQESKDSGFWSMSKFSFESTKSLSISDSHSNDSTSLNPQYPHNTNNSLLIPNQQNQFNKNQSANSNSYLNTNNVNNKTNNLNINNEEKTSSQTQNTSPNTSSNINENDLSSSRKYLSSPVGFSQTPIYNWKKWKKGQAWRYNSSNSNLSQSDCSSNTEDGNTRNSSLNYASFDSTTINPVHSNENDTNDSKQNIPNLNLTHANSHFSNSFEIPSSTNTNNNNQTLSSNLTIQSSNLNHHHSWSSTSRLDQLSSQIQINNSNYLNQSQHHQHQQQSYLSTFEPAKAQKRRGKLVRDRTIDNTDDHQSSLTALNGLNLSSNNLTNNHIKLENARFDSISSLISPLSISSNKDKENNNDSIIMNNSSNPTSPNTNTNKQNYSGRVSPPEKRVSLTNNENEQSQNSSLIMSHLNSNSSKYLSTEHPNKSFSISSSMVMNNRPTSKASASSSLSSSPAPTPSSIQDVMNSAAVVAAAAAIAAVMSNKNSNTGNNENNPAKSINYDSNCLLNQYDFYKDLQSKLIIKANDNEEMNQNKQKYISTTPSSLFNNNINNDNSNNNNNNSPSPSSPISSPNSKLLSMRQNNFLSNQHSKLVSRSNSSPSYSSLSSLPTTNAQTNQIIPSPIQFSSPSSTCLFQQNTAANTTNSLNQNVPNHFDASKLNLFSQVQSYNNSLAFNNKSISTCSLPLVTFSQATTPFNLSTNKLNQIDNNSNNFFGSSNRLTNPPEIVITESKIDHDQIDYEQQQNQQQQHQQQQQETQQLNKLNQFDQIKQENIFVAANLFSNKHKLNESVSNVYENNFKKEQENSLNNKLFENWKNLNPFIHHLTPTNNTILTTNNMNNLNANKMNLSNNSNISNASSKQAKPHVCPNCQKRFARSDMLIRHSRLHSGVRPYRCNRCGQEFSRSDHLNTHLRTHTGEKPYSCPHPKCTYAACRKDMITRHLKVHAKNRLTLSFDNANLPASVVNNNNTNATDNNNTNANTNTSNINKANQLAMSETATSKLIQFNNGPNSVSFEPANIGFLNTASNSNFSDTKAKMEDLKDIKNFEMFKQSK